ncbi:MULTISPECIES: YcaO-like family protein [Brevibacillus]|jgi:Uncharacterized conserved protein|uniref:YcaO domain-containing protein n=1 Tax=Brevibacillus parabrevis TaxID=54914 RepID=A0A4Y3PU81_BREPA|nr:MULTISPECIES: YcaO-like family protein [Brevibacillus]MED2255308.1 YcaO-like family protein [Brevibacillus parabrevis]RNB92584.1 hypothetical protein EDM60_25930 [Brevibacillus parabrevis]UED68449.1 YcaO-like family protein [Brevibacillus sp. HD3.3A]WDV94723.1 YcaO-like family protein [Brevibacillus parabrevis]GEB35566.1 hypothetical protein BPA01_51460 [Brevibacillus parabrevis]
MYYVTNSPNHGHAFVANRIWINKEIFQCGYSNCYVDCAIHKAAYGNSVKNNSRKAMAAAIGEHLERLALFAPRMKAIQENGSASTEAFNLITGDTIKIPLDFVILEYGHPIFKDKDMHSSFSDTCGVASHTSSAYAIEAAFLEFIERQSLIHTWLTKKAGRLLSLKLLEKQIVCNIIQMSKTYKGIQEFYLVDISITDDVHVVLALGFGKESFSIGAGAHWNLLDAVNRAMNEYFQFMTGFWGRENEGESIDGDLYYDFCNSLSPEKFREEYAFLTDNKRQLEENIPLTKTSQIDTFIERVQRVVNDLDISVYATCVPETMEFNTKVVKVFSPDCYPHMNTALLDPQKYRFSRKFDRSIYKNLNKLIPFP